MRLHMLGRGGSDKSGCPTLCATDVGSYVATGWKTGKRETIEIPHLLLGFAEPDTFLGATMTDTGRGTFLLSGRPITDAETLCQLDLASDETAIEVAKEERTFYGGISRR